MKKIIINYWPLFLIGAIWLAFSYPFFLMGLVPFPTTYIVDAFAPWSAYPELFAGPVKNGATPDVIGQIYPWKQLVIEMWKSGVVPLWNPYAFSGTPLLANYQSAAFTPFNLLYFIFSFNNAWSLQVLLQPFLAGVFMYLLTSSLKISRAGAVISSIAFMFCGFITTWMVYGTLAYAILFLPLALFAIEKFYGEKKSWYLVILALSIPLSFFSGHFQTSLYFAIFVVAYLLFKGITQKAVKESVYSFGAIFSGFLIAMPQLLPSIEFYFASVRSDLFLKLEDVPWGYLPTFLAPDFYGNPVTRNDWFGHYAEWNVYIGVIPLLLAGYALTKVNKVIVFFLSISVIVLFLSFQSPLLDVLVNLKIPVLSTSAASRILVLLSFSAAVLAGFGFDRLIHDIKIKNTKNIYIWLSVFAILFAILGYIVLAKILIPYDKNQIALSNLKLPIALFSLFAASVVLTILLKFKKKIVIITAVIVALVVFDMLRFSTKWMPFDPAEKLYPATKIKEFISEIDEPVRGFGSYGSEAAIYFDLPTIEGYDPLYIGRYGEFISSVDRGIYKSPGRSVVSFPKRGEYSDKALNLLGVKYLLHKISDGRQDWVFPFWEYPVDHFVKIYEDDSYEVYENHKVLPRAFIANDYEVITDDKEIITSFFSEEFDIKNNVILEKDLGIELSSGSAEIVTYSPNTITLKTSTDGPSLLFLSDPYYPGWKAFVNEAEAEILRSNYTFRAVVVPKGESTVRFAYSPFSFKMGIILSLAGLFAVFLLLYAHGNFKKTKN